MKHLKWLSIFDYILAVFSIIWGIVITVYNILQGLGLFFMDPSFGVVSTLITGICGITFIIISLVFTVLYIIAGRSIIRKEKWSRWLHLVIAIIQAGMFPLGTAYCVYCIWALFVNEEVKKIFE